MRFVVAVVGKPRDAHLSGAIREYESRASRYWPLEVREVRDEPVRSGSADLAREREGERPLGGSALSQSARTGQLPQWYRPIPRGSEEWIDYGRDVARNAPPTWFRDLEQAIGPTGRAAARLARTVEGQGLVVTTGQQPGLF